MTEVGVRQFRRVIAMGVVSPNRSRSFPQPFSDKMTDLVLLLCHTVVQASYALRKSLKGGSLSLPESRSIGFCNSLETLFGPL